MQQAMEMIHNGWSDVEKNKLFEEIKVAKEKGVSLRCVFEKMGQDLHRKPNSIRNFYYLQILKEMPECKRAAPFDMFSKKETDWLLQAILLAKGQGVSVRKCVYDLSNGDKKLMLRYQNKYRAILKKHPEMIHNLCEKMKSAGQTVSDPTHKAFENSFSKKQEQEDIRRLYDIISKMVVKNDNVSPSTMDKLKVQRDIALYCLDDLKRASNALIHVLKDFIAQEKTMKIKMMDLFLEEVCFLITDVENAGHQTAKEKTS